jgi:hypothetical protein
LRDQSFAVVGRGAKNHSCNNFAGWNSSSGTFSLAL